MSVLQYARIVVADNALTTPHDRTARNDKPVKAQKRTKKPGLAKKLADVENWLGKIPKDMSIEDLLQALKNKK